MSAWHASSVAMSIEDPETERLVRALAVTTGESTTVTIRLAVQERLDRLQHTGPSTVGDELDAILERGRRRARHPDRAEDALLDYGPDGLPV